MRRAFLCALVVPALVGCDLGTSEGEVSGSTRGDGAVTTGPDATPAAPPEAAFVYTAVLEQAVEDAWIGRGQPRFRALLVVDGVVPHAAKPTRTEDPRYPFAADLKEGMRLLGEQGELPPIEFVADREAQGRNKALLVSLEGIRGGSTRAEVGASLSVGVRPMLWLTYVVKERRGAWRVVGTTGPLAIS